MWGNPRTYYVYDGWNCVAIFNPSLALLDSFKVSDHLGVEV